MTGPRLPARCMCCIKIYSGENITGVPTINLKQLFITTCDKLNMDFVSRII